MNVGAVDERESPVMAQLRSVRERARGPVSGVQRTRFTRGEFIPF